MFPRLAAAAAVLVLVVLVPEHATARVACGRPTARDFARLPAEWPRFRRALVASFGPDWREAATVAFGESRWTPGAANGQYLGYFQMGAYERQLTGWTSDAAGQVRAASLYNRLTGGRFGPWDCRP